MNKSNVPFPECSAMINTKLFKHGDSQAVRIPSELAYTSWDIELVMERHGDELCIRPARRRMGDVLDKFAQFSPEFMNEGRDPSGPSDVLVRLRKFRGRLPAGFCFARRDANERG